MSSVREMTAPERKVFLGMYEEYMKAEEEAIKSTRKR